MPAPLECDVVVLGSGFGGSLTALLLNRIGLRPVLIDRGRHPRFAIGESSTPVADLVLSDLCGGYDLPRLKPLAKYGSWQQTYPGLRCGLKRGFSYFRHERGNHFTPAPAHANELLVAASSDDQHSDTHWHRADVDAFFAAEVRDEGLPFFEGVEATVERASQGWRVSGGSSTAAIDVTARFLIDATGEASVLRRTLGIADASSTLRTRSRAIFAHFTGVRRWQEVLPDDSAEDFPFPCDAAALHQVLEEGWMWQLRFDNGVVSAGFAIDEAMSPLDAAVPIEEEWRRVLLSYPSLARQFAESSIIDPPGGLRRTGRMQRLASQIVGENWAMLPNTAGFIDPLHSTGIAQTLCGVERLIAILEKNWQRTSLVLELSRYQQTLRDEFDLIDRIVSMGYASRQTFRLFAAVAMLYFAAATTYERRRQAGELRSGAAFLCADDSRFREAVQKVERQLLEMLASSTSDAAIKAFERDAAAALQPFNHVGLFDQASQNMYRYTAARQETKTGDATAVTSPVGVFTAN